MAGEVKLPVDFTQYWAAELWGACLTRLWGRGTEELLSLVPVNDALGGDARDGSGYIATAGLWNETGDTEVGEEAKVERARCSTATGKDHSVWPI